MKDDVTTIGLSEAFLVSIINKTLNYWEENKVVNLWDIEKHVKGRGCLHDSGSIYATPHGNLTFTLYNFLGLFHGHYKIWVNPNTFEYKIKKAGEYCTFTTIAPPDDDTVYTKDMLSTEQQIEIEGHIANTLYMFFYSSYKHPYGAFSTSLQKLVFGSCEEDF